MAASTGSADPHRDVLRRDVVVHGVDLDQDLVPRRIPLRFGGTLAPELAPRVDALPPADDHVLARLRLRPEEQAAVSALRAPTDRRHRLAPRPGESVLGEIASLEPMNDANHGLPQEGVGLVVSTIL